jgi:hypothetical protein
MNYVRTDAGRRVLAVTLLAGAMAATMTACLDNSPVGPGAGPDAQRARGGVSIAQAPENDERATAVVVPGLPFTHTVNTTEATAAPDDPQDCGFGPSVWYRFTATADARLLATTFGSDYDTVLGVYVDEGGGLTLLGCNDDTGTLQSAVAFDAIAGQTYYFLVTPFAGEGGGTLVFNLAEDVPLEGHVTIARTGTIDKRAGTAVVRGTVTCNEPSFVEIFGVLRDRIGRIRVNAEFSTFVECTGEAAWEAFVFPQTAFLVPGPADVEVVAVFTDVAFTEQVVDDASRRIKLKQGKATRSIRQVARAKAH